jgi:hypothetical protein
VAGAYCLLRECLGGVRMGGGMVRGGTLGGPWAGVFKFLARVGGGTLGGGTQGGPWAGCFKCWMSMPAS